MSRQLVRRSDLVATGALKACQHLRRQVPGDVAVVGFDDITLAAYVEPPLTTLRVPARVLGQEAMRILLEQLDEPGREREEILLEPRLIVRRSAP